MFSSGETSPYPGRFSNSVPCTHGFLLSCIAGTGSRGASVAVSCINIWSQQGVKVVLFMNSFTAILALAKTTQSGIGFCRNHVRPGCAQTMPLLCMYAFIIEWSTSVPHHICVLLAYRQNLSGTVWTCCMHSRISSLHNLCCAVRLALSFAGLPASRGLLGMPQRTPSSCLRSSTL